MKWLSLFLITTYLHAENNSSISSLHGDRNTAPINEPGKNQVPGDKVVAPVDSKKIDQIIEQAREAWANEKEKVLNDALVHTPKNETESPISELPQEASTIKSEEKILTKTLPKRPKFYSPSYEPLVIPHQTGKTVTIFRSNLSKDEEMITLPSGAHAFGRVKFGEEVIASGQQEVLVEMDYAFLGPNSSVVEMTGCIAWMNVTSNFNTQRVKGALQDMTCTMKGGRVFTVPLQGPIVDVSTGYAGVDSNIIMRGPAKTAALKFLSEITTAYGSATAAVQTTTNIINGGGFPGGPIEVDKATNVTGNGNQYVMGKVIEANGKFLDYIASFFSSMQPTLALAPGAKVHIINRNNVKIPKAFFKIDGEKS